MRSFELEARTPGDRVLRCTALCLVTAFASVACGSGDNGSSSGDENTGGASTGIGGDVTTGGGSTASGGSHAGSGGNTSGGSGNGGGHSDGNGGSGDGGDGNVGSGGSAGNGNAGNGGSAGDGTGNGGSAGMHAGGGSGGASAGGKGNGNGGAAGSGGKSNGNGGAAGSGGKSNGNGGTQGNGGSSNGGACAGGKPTAANTGYPQGTSLTVVNGDVTVSQDNTTLDAQDIHGFLIIKASHVHVTRCLVRGGTATHNGDGINVQSGTDILIEDTEVALEHPSAYLDGVAGSNLTVRRANIHGGVDGMKVGSNSTVECSYIHDMASFASDPNQNGGATHNDAIQILSGVGIHITGNQLVAAKDQNSAIQVTEDFGAVSDLHIESNWADGGGCTFNFSHKGADSLTVSALNNRFGRNSFYGCPILKSTKTTLTASGNVYDDDGTPVPVQTHD
jgi:hypothetical protein